MSQIEVTRIEDLLKEFDLQPYRNEILDSALNHVKISKITYDAQIVSAFGENPLLPEYQNWPLNPKGMPLTFICQISFSEIDQNCSELPVQGLLSIFYDKLEEKRGAFEEDLNYWKVFYFEDVARLIKKKMPQSQLETVKQFSMMFEKHLSFPDLVDRRFGQLLPTLNESVKQDRKFFDCYDDFLEKLYGDPKHSLLGYPRLLQGDVRIDYLNKGREIQEEPSDSVLDNVQLLLQLTSDYEANFELYEMGTLFVQIDKRDMMKKDFSNCWVTIQSS